MNIFLQSPRQIFVCMGVFCWGKQVSKHPQIEGFDSLSNLEILRELIKYLHQLWLLTGGMPILRRVPGTRPEMGRPHSEVKAGANI